MTPKIEVLLRGCLESSDSLKSRVTSDDRIELCKAAYDAVQEYCSRSSLISYRLRSLLLGLSRALVYEANDPISTLRWSFYESPTRQELRQVEMAMRSAITLYLEKYGADQATSKNRKNNYVDDEENV